MAQSNLNTKGGRVWYLNGICGLSTSQTGWRFDGFYGNHSLDRTHNQSKSKSKFARIGKTARSLSAGFGK